MGDIISGIDVERVVAPKVSSYRFKKFFACGCAAAVMTCFKNVSAYVRPRIKYILFSLLESCGVKYYRNDSSGTVTVYSDGEEIFVTEACDVFRLSQYPCGIRRYQEKRRLPP